MNDRAGGTIYQFAEPLSVVLLLLLFLLLLLLHLHLHLLPHQSNLNSPITVLVQGNRVGCIPQKNFPFSPLFSTIPLLATPTASTASTSSSPDPPEERLWC